MSLMDKILKRNKGFKDKELKKTSKSPKKENDIKDNEIFYLEKELGPIDPSNPFLERILAKSTFDEMMKEDKYYTNRWDYFEEVIHVLERLDDVETVLEMGPYKLPFVKESDIIDRNDKYIDFYPIEINEFIRHDCSKTPYPIEDKKYDLIIACQVIEHLGIKGEQKAIFDEFERISNKVLLTLPYKWHAPDQRDHHMIDKKMIKSWADGREPVYELVNRNRILQFYDFNKK